MAHAALVIGIAILSQVSAIQVTVKNNCAELVNLYDNIVEIPIAPGASTVKDMPPGYIGMLRAGKNPQATLAEFSVNGGRVWYDISIIPTGGPGPGFCPSLDECKRVTGGVGFNLPMQMTPVDKADGQRCKELTCLFDGCPDAYLFPKDDIKTHNCPDGTNFIVTFCPGAPAPAGSSAPGTPEPEVAADLLDIPATTAPVTNPPTTPPTLLDSSSSEAHSVEHDVADDGNASSSGSEESHSVVELEASDSNTASTPATTDAPLKEVNTKSSSEGGSTVGVVLVCIFVLVGAVAAATIFTVRAKKRTLDEEPKSPAILDSSFIQIRL